MAVDMKSSIIPRREDGKDRGHLLPVPLWLGIVRIAQGVLAILVLILAAASAADYRIVTSIGQAFSIFATLWTLLYFAYLLVTAFFLPEFYNFWANLALECLSVLWWLTSFATLAAEVATLAALGYFTNGAINYSFDVRVHRAGIGCHQGATGLAAIVWLSFIVTLVFLSIDCHRARTGKGPRTAPGPAEVHGGVEMDQQYPPQDKQPYVQQQQQQQPLLSNPTPQMAVQAPYSDQPQYPPQHQQQQQQQPYPQGYSQEPHSYPPQQLASPPHQQASPQHQQAYPEQQQPSPHQQQAYPQQQGYPQQTQGYPPQQPYGQA